MSFDSRESSRALGEPYELYYFKYGDKANNYYAYTNAEQDVTWQFDEDIGPVVFHAVTIMRDEISSSGSLDKSTINVSFEEGNVMANKFRLYPPSQVVILKIWQGHIDDTGKSLIWAGRVLGLQHNEDEVQFTCEPSSQSLRRNGARRNYQYGCPLPLYGEECRADLDSATYAGETVSVDGPLITLSNGWVAAELKTKFIGGYVSWLATDDNRLERRSIIQLSNSNNTLLLGGVATGLEAGQVIELVLGCNHIYDPEDTSTSDCLHLHDNILNYGGQPWIPLKNPIGLLNNFY